MNDCLGFRVSKLRLREWSTPGFCQGFREKKKKKIIATLVFMQER